MAEAIGGFQVETVEEIPPQVLATRGSIVRIQSKSL